MVSASLNGNHSLALCRLTPMKTKLEVTECIDPSWHKTFLADECEFKVFDEKLNFVVFYELLPGGQREELVSLLPGEVIGIRVVQA